MPSDNKLPRDLSIARLYRETGGRNWEREYLAFNSPDVVLEHYDFIEPESVDVTEGVWNIATGVDGSLDHVANGVSGEATLDVGDAATSGDNEYGGIATALHYKGDLYAHMEARIKISDASNVKVEVGFTDAINDAGAALVLATPTATATDAAIWVLDTDDTALWQAFAVNSDGTPQKLEPTVAEATAGATYVTLGVGLYNDNAVYWLKDANGDVVYDSIRNGDGMIESAIEGGTALTPWLFVQNRSASQDRLITIDYVRVWQRRVVA